METTDITSTQPLWWQKHAWNESLHALLLELPHMSNGGDYVESFLHQPIRFAYQSGVSGFAPGYDFLTNFYAELDQRFPAQPQSGLDAGPSLDSVVEASDYDRWVGYVRNSGVQPHSEAATAMFPFSHPVDRAIDYAYSVKWTDDEVRRMLTELTGLSDPAEAIRSTLGSQDGLPQSSDAIASTKGIAIALMSNPHLGATATGDSVFDIFATETVTALRSIQGSIAKQWVASPQVQFLRSNSNMPLHYLEEASVVISEILENEGVHYAVKHLLRQQAIGIERRLSGTSRSQLAQDEAVKKAKEWSDEDLLAMVEGRWKDDTRQPDLKSILPQVLYDPAREAIARKVTKILVGQKNWWVLCHITPALGTLLAETEEEMGVPSGSIPAEWLLEVVGL